MIYKIFLAWQSQNKATADFVKYQIRRAVNLLGEKGYDIGMYSKMVTRRND